MPETSVHDQYDTVGAPLHDALVGGDEAAVRSASRCAALVAGRRVLDVGTGTGRVARLLSAGALSVVGIDNAPAMLELARRVPTPPNVHFVQADFRGALPVGVFNAAVSTTGSLASTASLDELVAVLANIGLHLEPGAAFGIEYYARSVYQTLASLGKVEYGDSGRWITLEAGIECDTLTMRTTVAGLHDAPVTLVERVLLPDAIALRDAFTVAGYTVEEFMPAEGVSAFDWWTLRKAGPGGSHG